MDLHPGETELFHGHPSWRSTLLHYVTSLAVAVVVGAIVWFAVSHGAGVAAAIAIFVLGVVIGYLRRLGTTYIITNERLHIRKGIVSKDVQETRIDRVQNVNTKQSIFQRLLQIGVVDFDTAGNDDADFRFDGVAQPEEVVRAVDKAQRESRGAVAPPTAQGV